LDPRGLVPQVNEVMQLEMETATRAISTEVTTMTASLCRIAPVILVLFGSLAASATAVADKPNIVFFLVDDLGQRDLGCYGSTFYETPNIDRLAGQGAKLTNGYAACPVCSPTRASIMTGKYPQRTGVTDYIGAAQPPQ